MSSSAAPSGDASRQPRLYGRRRGRALRSGRRTLVETLLPQISFSLSENEAPLDPRRLFGAAPDDVWLEIGFGGGEHLAYQAETHPGCGLIGCEVFEPGVARLLGEIDRRKLRNIRLFVDDARLLIAALAPQSLGRAFILFPDPWPKERHKKRRIVSRETLDQLAAALRDGGELRIATDVLDYAQWIAERMAAHESFERIESALRPADWPATKYELKAKEGRAADLFWYRRRPR